MLPGVVAAVLEAAAVAVVDDAPFEAGVHGLTAITIRIRVRLRSACRRCDHHRGGKQRGLTDTARLEFDLHGVLLTSEESKRHAKER
jgi:hypothetical protein